MDFGAYFLDQRYLWRSRTEFKNAIRGISFGRHIHAGSFIRRRRANRTARCAQRHPCRKALQGEIEPNSSRRAWPIDRVKEEQRQERCANKTVRRAQQSPYKKTLHAETEPNSFRNAWRSGKVSEDQLADRSSPCRHGDRSRCREIKFRTCSEFCRQIMADHTVDC